MPDNATASPRLRLLVVDDNIDAAESLAAVIDLHGHDVRAAFGGVQALRVHAEWQPDVVVLDIGMPGMDGYEVCRRIRSDSQARQPVLVACTGWGHDADRQRALAAGFDVHLVKPVDPDELLRVLRDTPRRS